MTTLNSSLFKTTATTSYGPSDRQRKHAHGLDVSRRCCMHTTIPDKPGENIRSQLYFAHRKKEVCALFDRTDTHRERERERVARANTHTQTQNQACVSSGTIFFLQSSDYRCISCLRTYDYTALFKMNNAFI